MKEFIGVSLPTKDKINVFVLKHTKNKGSGKILKGGAEKQSKKK